MEIYLNGVGLKNRFGLMLNDFNHTPALPKFYEIDIPGGDSVIDQTEALSGDIAYEDQEFEFIFDAPQKIETFTKTLTSLKSYLHGRHFDFKLSWDEDYTYSGRFYVNQMKCLFTVGTVAIKCKAKPYKSKGYQVRTVDAQAGAIEVLDDIGRGRVQPVFESAMPIHVISGDVDVRLPAGAHTAVGLFCNRDNNEIYVNSGAELLGGNTTWGDIEGRPWSDFEDMSWYELYWLNGKPDPSDEYKVKIGYEIKEL